MYHVLIVDDEETIVNGMKKIIQWEEMGFSRVDSATSAAEAFELYQKNNYDVLITDIQMQDMTGLEMISIMQKRHMGVKTVVLSSYNNFDYVKKALQLGIENYLLKPIDENELKITLSQIIEKIEMERKYNYLNHLKESTMMENTLEMWAKGEITKDMLETRMQMYDIETHYLYYNVCIFYTEKEILCNEESYIKEEKITDKIAGVYSNDRRKINAVWTTDNNLLLIVCCNEIYTSDEIEKLMREIREICTSILFGTWKYIIGKTVKKYNQIVDSYIGAMHKIREEQSEIHSDPCHKVVKEIVYQLQNNYREQYSLKTLAFEYGMSQAYLGRLFKKGTGQFFSDYLCQIRIEKAKKLLCETDLKTSEIGEIVGFINQSYFTTVFKEKVGVYPAMYRKNNSVNRADRGTRLQKEEL